jgi:hypothetical protein
MKVYQYRVYCETDAKWEYIWLDETVAAPTTCPVNSGHTITSSSVAIHSKSGPDLQTLKPFADADGFRARFKGVAGTMNYGTTTNLDYTLSEERYIDGVEILQNNAAVGDSVKFQVVHPTYGVLDEFGDSWYINASAGFQSPVILSYPAKIPAGLTIRVVYNSVGNTNVWLGANLRLHKKT